MSLFDTLKRGLGIGQPVARPAPIRTPAPTQTVSKPVASTALPNKGMPGFGVVRPGAAVLPQIKAPVVKQPSFGDTVRNSIKQVGTAASLGAVRSATGLGQGVSGLVDLATPGTGTSRVSKGLDNFAKSVDQTAKTQVQGPARAAYKIGQVAGDAAQFLAPTTALKVASKVPALAKASNVVTKLAGPGDRLATALGNKVAVNAPGRILGAGIRSGLSPAGLLNAGSATAFQQGQEASKGRDISPVNTGLSLAQNLGGGMVLGGAGQAVKEVTPALKASGKFIDKEVRAANDKKGLAANYDATINNLQKQKAQLQGRIQKTDNFRGVETTQRHIDQIDNDIATTLANKPKLNIKDRLLAPNIGLGMKAVHSPDLNLEQNQFIEEYAKMLKDQGQGNGVNMVKTADGYKRVSNNIRDDNVKGQSLNNSYWFDKARAELESGKGAYGASDEYRNVGQIQDGPPLSIPEGFDSPKIPDFHAESLDEARKAAQAYTTDTPTNLYRGINDTNTSQVHPDRPTYYADNPEYAATYGKVVTESGKGKMFNADSSNAYSRIAVKLGNLIRSYPEYKVLGQDEKDAIAKYSRHTLFGDELSATFQKQMPEIVKKAFHDMGIDHIRVEGGTFKGTVGNVGHQTEIIALPKPKQTRDPLPINKLPVMSIEKPTAVVAPAKKPVVRLPGEAVKAPSRPAPLLPEEPRVSSSSNNTPRMSIPEDAPSSGMRQRGLSTTIQNDPNTAPQLKAGVGEMYKVRNTKDLQSRAQNLINDDPNLARRVFDSDSNSDVGTMIGSQLSRHYSQTGQHEAALEIAQRLSREATNRGQANQALSTWGKLAPESVLRFAQSTVNEYNRKAGLIGGRGELQITPEQAKGITAASEKLQAMPDGRAKDIATQQMLGKVKELVPASWVKKLGTVQTIGQLLNPKTLIRNILGNGIFNPLESASQTISAGLDKGISAIRGSERTTALPQLGAQVRGAIKGGKSQIEELNKGVNLGPETQYDLKDVPTFRSGAMSKVEKALGYALRVPDRAAFQAAYDDTVQGLMKANKLDKPTQAILDQAEANGLYRTFQDNSTAAKLFTKLKGALNTLGVGGKDGARFGLGDAILKYPKTPGNLIGRGIDYSPVGIVSGIVKAMSNAAAGKPFDQHALVNSIGRGTVGTSALIGSGAILGGLGIITEKPSEDADTRNLQKASGQGGYQINTSALLRFMRSGFNKDDAKLKEGDTLVSYDWAQPASIPLSVGAAIGKKQSPKDAAVSTVTGISDGLNSLIEQPLVTGVNTFANNIKNKGIAGAGMEAVKGLPASFVPTASNQARQLTDNTTRNTYSDNTGQQVVQSIKNKIPVLSKDVPARIDPFGKDQQNYQNGSNNVGNVLFNPAFVNKYKPNEAAKLPLDILKNTGETKQNPLTPKTKQTVNGKDIQLTPKQNQDFAKYIGSNTADAFNKLSKDAEFLKQPQTDQAKKMSGILTDINAAAKVAVLGDNPKSLSASSKAIIGGKTASYTDAKISDSLDKDSKHFLTKYGELNDEQKKANSYKENDFDYKYAVAKFANDKANGDISKAGEIEAKNNIDKLKVGKDYSKDVRELYSKNEADIAEFVSKPGNEKYANQLLDYDQALHNAGLTKNLKYKGGINSKAASGKAAVSGSSVSYSNTTGRGTARQIRGRKLATKAGNVQLRSVKPTGARRA